jgi:hypothetical protein
MRDAILAVRYVTDEACYHTYSGVELVLKEFELCFVPYSRENIDRAKFRNLLFRSAAKAKNC